MLQTYTLQTVDELLHAFSPVRNRDEDTFPFVGANAELAIKLDDSLQITGEYASQFKIDPMVTGDALFLELAKRTGIVLKIQ